MTILGAVFLALIAFGFVKRRAFPWILALSAAFPYSAAIVAAGTTVYPFHLAAAGATALLVFDRAGARRPVARALVTPLALFVGWSLFITAIGPMIFAGQPVLGARTGIDEAIESQDPLAFSLSMLAQAAYLTVASGAAIYIATHGPGPRIALVPFAIGTVLGTINLICITFGLPWPAALFDTSPNVFYSYRYRGGIFNEPSEFGGFSVAAAALFAVMIARTRGWLRVGSIALTVLACINLSQVRAGTALVGLVLIVGLGVGAIIWRVMTTGRGAVFVFFAAGASTVVAIVAGARVSSWATDIFQGKIASESLNARSSSDLFSLELSLQTWGLGVGLGANRPSSFVTMLLSCVGVIGLAAFTVLMIRLLSRSFRASPGTPYAWGLIAFLAAKAVSLPDLTTPGMWMLIAACMAVAGQIELPPKMASNFPDSAPEIGLKHGPQGPHAGGTTALDTDRGTRASGRRTRPGVHPALQAPVRRNRAALRRYAGQ